MSPVPMSRPVSELLAARDAWRFRQRAAKLAHEELIGHCERMVARGVSIRQVARLIGVSDVLVGRWLRKSS